MVESNNEAVINDHWESDANRVMATAQAAGGSKSGGVSNVFIHTH
jgi:hypothetical protein